MRIGYARISTGDQNLGLQIDALTAAKCDRIFEEVESGAKCDRTILTQCLAALSPGDCLVVWRLDRLGRSLKHLLEIVEGLKNREIAFVSLNDAIDTTTPMGELLFHFSGAFAQFERQLIKQRCSAGMKAAQLRGQHCGRPATATFKIQAVDQLLTAGDSVASACLKIGINKSTYYRSKKRQPFATAAS